jgi:hypothetical protein
MPRSPHQSHFFPPGLLKRKPLRHLFLSSEEISLAGEEIMARKCMSFLIDQMTNGNVVHLIKFLT